MKNIYIIFILFLGLSAYAQGESNNWYFGNKAAVNFAGTPVALTNSVMNAPQACGSVSDSQGNLLFYTDGMTIWNREHKVMLNGTGLAGTSKSGQVLIIKSISSSTKYYVFTTADAYGSQSHIAYSVVDMSLGTLGGTGQPLGGVSSVKNIPMLDNNGSLIQTGGVTAIPHNNGVDFWILVGNHDDLLAYLFDNSGVSATPVVSSFQMTVNGPFYIKASPLMNVTASFNALLAIGMDHSSGNYLMNVYSFDSSMGLITPNYYSNELCAQCDDFSAEFGKDGTLLYTSLSSSNFPFHQIHIHDLKASSTSSITASHQIYQSSNLETGQLQRDKNNDIYYNRNNTNYIGKISNPTNTYFGSSVNPTSVFLNGAVSRKGLPQLFPRHSANCINDILLTAPENNTNYTYHAVNTIITQSNYIMSNKDITMKAGESITLLPNTEIGKGSDYLAIIENCVASKPALIEWPEGPVRLNSVTGAENKSLLVNDFSVYPNPTNSSFVIDIANNEIQNWELFDLSGKLVVKGNQPTGSVDGLAKATYVLKISLKNKEVKTYKLIVK